MTKYKLGKGKESLVMNHLACLQKKESRIKLLYAAGAMWTYFLRLRAEKCAAKSCSDTKVLADVCWFIVGWALALVVTLFGCFRLAAANGGPTCI